MKEVVIDRHVGLSMPKMSLIVDDVAYRISISNNSVLSLQLSDGPHRFEVKCGGYSSSKIIDTTEVNRIIIKPFIPLLPFCVYVGLIVLFFILYQLDVLSNSYFYFLSLFFFAFLFYVSVFKKQSYFKLIPNK